MMLSSEFTASLKDWTVYRLTDVPAQLLAEVVSEQIEQPHLLVGEVVLDNSGRWQPGHIVKTTWVSDWDRQAGEVRTLNGLYKLDGEPMRQQPLIDASMKQLLEAIGLRHQRQQSASRLQ